MSLRIEIDKTATGKRAYFVRRYDPIGMLTAGGPLDVFQSADFDQCRAYVRGYNEACIALEFSNTDVAYPSGEARS